MRRAVPLLAVFLAAGCDDFGKLGTCSENPGKCQAVCSATNPVFLPDFGVLDAGEVPAAVWVGSGGGVWVGTRTNSIYRQSSGSWVREFLDTQSPSLFSGEAAFWGTTDAPEYAGGFVGLTELRAGSGTWASTSFANGNNVFQFSGTSDANLWAAADGHVFHSNASGWNDLTVPPGSNWQGIWASPSTADVWSVGYQTPATQVAVAFNIGADVGVPLTMTGYPGAPAGQLETAWGFSPTDVWAVGTDNSGNALNCRYDGGLWGCAALPAGGHAFGIWGRTTNDVWVSAQEVILHWDGARWTQAQIQAQNPDGGPMNFYRIWGNDSQVWAAGDVLVHCP